MEKYQQTLRKLFSMLPMFQREGVSAYKADLRNITVLLEALGNPQGGFKSIHIAGTNGKGSTAHILASLLQENGLKVGLHTSPHYMDFRERIKLNGEMINRETVVEFVEHNERLITELKPSFFEFSVAMAFSVFQEQAVDIAVIETGLGGRLDSTNILQPILCIITNISYDHQAILGDTLKEIAAEKAGIIKPETPVVIGEKQDETIRVFKDIASANNASLHYAEDRFRLRQLDAEIDSLRFSLESEGERCEIKTSFSGAFQKYNILTAIAAYKLITEMELWLHLEWNCAILNAALCNIQRNTGFIGRWQLMGTSPLVVLDSAHNESGIIRSIEQIKNYEYEILHIVLGFASDKDWKKLLNILPDYATYYCVRPDVPRGLDIGILHRKMILEGFKARKYDSVIEGLNAAYKHASAYDVILVIGSAFVVAEALLWKKEDN